MSNDTVTVKVVESGDDSSTQESWIRKLGAFCTHLVSSGAARSAHVEAVFPEDPNPAMATLFTIDFEPAGVALEQPLSKLRAIPGVMFASIAATRRPLPLARPKAAANAFRGALIPGKRTV